MGLVNTVVPLERLEEETVGVVPRDARPLPLRAAARSRRASTPHEDGYAGIQQLAHDANLLFYGSEEAAEGREAYKEKRTPDFSQFPAGRERAERHPRAHLADGGAAADAAGRGRAGARRHRAGGHRGHVQDRSRSSPR